VEIHRSAYGLRKDVMAILFAMAVALFVQDSSAAAWPSLHQRPIFASEEDRAIAAWDRGAANFPQDAAGFYRFRDPVQGVQIVTYGGMVSGYLLKFGRGRSDKGLVLGYEFREVAGSRDQLYFTTRQVHGVWYGFEGQVVTRHGLSESVDGNYILEGTLTIHDESQQTTEQESVRLRSPTRH
jgi:hypothetical protein